MLLGLAFGIATRAVRFVRSLVSTGGDALVDQDGNPVVAR